MIKRFLFRFVKWWFIISIGLTVAYRFIPIPFTWTMLVNLVSTEKKYDKLYDWESLENISPEAALAFVAAEDQLFFEHHGFDFESMQKAFKGNQQGKKVRGGSTISQQVAKNVFLWQKQSYFRKAVEAYFTVLIELIWGKERILEVYLNVAELGHRTFGVEAASQNFFKKSAKKLTRDEAARLAAVLPSPKKWSAKNPGGYVRGRTNKISRQMRALGGKSFLQKEGMYK